MGPRDDRVFGKLGQHCPSPHTGEVLAAGDVPVEHPRIQRLQSQVDLEQAATSRADRNRLGGRLHRAAFEALDPDPVERGSPVFTLVGGDQIASSGTRRSARYRSAAEDTRPYSAIPSQAEVPLVLHRPWEFWEHIRRLSLSLLHDRDDEIGGVTMEERRRPMAAVVRPRSAGFERYAETGVSTRCARTTVRSRYTPLA